MLYGQPQPRFKSDSVGNTAVGWGNIWHDSLWGPIIWLIIDLLTLGISYICPSHDAWMMWRWSQLGFRKLDTKQCTMRQSKHMETLIAQQPQQKSPQQLKHRTRMSVQTACLWFARNILLICWKAGLLHFPGNNLSVTSCHTCDFSLYPKACCLNAHWMCLHLSVRIPQ